MTGCGCGIEGMTGGKRKGGAGDQAAQAAQAAPAKTGGNFTDDLKKKTGLEEKPWYQFWAGGRRTRRRRRRRTKYRHPRKGQRSRTRRGRLDFTTKKSSRVFNRRGHYQHRSRKGVKRRPYRTRRRR